MAEAPTAQASKPVSTAPASKSASAARNNKAAKSLVARYRRPPFRVEPLGRLVDFIPGTPDPLETGDREVLVGREEWEKLDTRRRHQAVGFLRRSFLVSRHLLRPPRYYARSARSEIFDRPHTRMIKTPKVVFRYKDVPMSALAPKYELPVTPLIGMAPRRKTTPLEDLPVFLNSRLFHFHWHRAYPKRAGQPPVPAQERLASFPVPMLTKKAAATFRGARDEILKLGRENGERLVAMDRVGKIAREAKVTLLPLGETEGIIREINVPKPLGEVADVKRRGPVVIFRRGSTIVTTTEEAATYLELWLQERFDQLRGMSKEELEGFIKMPISTAHVVVVLQHRARIEAEIDRTQTRVDALQREAEERLYELYGLTPAEREFLRSAHA